MKNFIGVFALLLLLVGCKSTKNTTESGGGKVGSKKVVEIVSQISELESSAPKYVSFKAEAQIKTEEKNQSVKVSLRMVKDSAIWISITSFKYEAIRILATPDSLKYLDRVNKKFYVGDYTFIQSKVGVELGYKEIQSLLYGHSFGLDEATSISKRNDKNHYVLSTLNKREVRNVAKDKEWMSEDVEVLFSNWINPESFKTPPLNRNAWGMSSGATGVHADRSLWAKGGIRCTPPCCHLGRTEVVF